MPTIVAMAAHPSFMVGRCQVNWQRQKWKAGGRPQRNNVHPHPQVKPLVAIGDQWL
jgi:hypothetical protein